MKKVLRRERSGYILGLIVCLIGLILLAVALWKLWPHVSVSQNALTELWSYLWKEQLELALGIELRLIYLTVLGILMFFSGAVMVALSQKWFTLSGEAILLTCPYCKNQWKTSRAKGWAECPHCRQFIQPQVAKRS